MNYERKLQDIAVQNSMWAIAADLSLEQRLPQGRIIENFGMHILQGVVSGSIDTADLRMEMYALNQLEKEVLEIGMQELAHYLDIREAHARQMGRKITHFSYEEVGDNAKLSRKDMYAAI